MLCEGLFGRHILCTRERSCDDDVWWIRVRFVSMVHLQLILFLQRKEFTVEQRYFLIDADEIIASNGFLEGFFFPSQFDWCCCCF